MIVRVSCVSRGRTRNASEDAADVIKEFSRSEIGTAKEAILSSGDAR